MKRLGSLKRVLVGAVLLGASIGVANTIAARAAAGGPLTAVDGAFVGTVGDDVLIIGAEGGSFTHNHGSDPGFAGNKDFDSTVPGVQTKAADGARVQFSLGEGDDTLRLIGNIPFPIAFSGGDFGGGSDTLDATAFGSPAGGLSLDYGNGTIAATVETVLGSPYNDRVDMANVTGKPKITVRLGAGNDFVWGTQGDDTLDLGAGDNEIHAWTGHDAIAFAAPFPTTRRSIETYDGDDTVVVTGTDAAEDFAFVVLPNEGGPRITVLDVAHLDGGYVLPYGITTATFNLLGGNDTLEIDSIFPSVIDGGSGTDEVFFNANEATATVASGGGDTLVTLPAFRYFATGAPTTARLKSTESRLVFNETTIATGPGPGGGPHVRTFAADGTPRAEFFAYGADFHGGVSVALGDLDGDLDDEIVTGAGPGGGPHVRIFRSDGSDTGVGFFAYGPDFHGGVNVATVDVDGDGVDEIVTVPAQGGGPHVRLWSGDGELLDEFFADAFDNTGLHAAVGSTLVSDGGRELLLSAANGRTRVESLGGTSLPDFEPYPGFGGGSSVAAAEVDAGPPRNRNDYHDEIVTGAGAGGGPHVKVFESSITTDRDAYTVLTSFFAYHPNFRGGVDVATCNIDGLDDEIVTGPGAGGGPHVRVFNGKTGAPLTTSFMAYDPNFHGGVRVACGGSGARSI